MLYKLCIETIISDIVWSLILELYSCNIIDMQGKRHCVKSQTISGELLWVNRRKHQRNQKKEMHMQQHYAAQFFHPKKYIQPNFIVERKSHCPTASWLFFYSSNNNTEFLKVCLTAGVNVCRSLPNVGIIWYFTLKTFW